MSLSQRFLGVFDAPRFCRDCGEPIRVQDLGAFDPTTGEQREYWVWGCPKVYLSHGGGRFRASQSGDHIHPYGEGRPRWHRIASSDSREQTAAPVEGMRE